MEFFLCGMASPKFAFKHFQFYQREALKSWMWKVKIYVDVEER